MKIDNRSQNKWTFFNTEKKITRLLEFIPPEHLVGLDRIVILDEARSADKKKKPVRGQYVPKKGREPAYIEIAIRNVFKGMPKVFFILPFMTNFMFANVLYHEIGHHYARLTHGITTQKQEMFANKYKATLLIKAFKFWGILLLPFRPLIRLLSRPTKFTS